MTIHRKRWILQEALASPSLGMEPTSFLLCSNKKGYIFTLNAIQLK